MIKSKKMDISRDVGCVFDISQVKNTIAAENSDFIGKWNESENEYNILFEIIRIRKEKKITQKDLAKMIDTKQQVISKMEKRENSPKLKTICKIANALGYDLKLVKRNK